MQITVSGKAFNCFHFAAVSLDGKHGAGFYGLPVEHYRAGSAQRRLATHVSACQTQNVPKVMNQKYARFNFVRTSDTIHAEADSLFHELPHFASLCLVDLLSDF
jgi:hypothetical protein